MPAAGITSIPLIWKILCLGKTAYQAVRCTMVDAAAAILPLSFALSDCCMCFQPSPELIGNPSAV